MGGQPELDDQVRATNSSGISRNDELSSCQYDIVNALVLLESEVDTTGNGRG
jgi:hypothetical protein